MTFASPLYFLLLLLLIPFVLWHFFIARRHEPAVTISTSEPYRHLRGTFRTSFIHLPFVLRMIAFVLLIIILARPQTHNALHEREVEGIDIMLAMDISTSMLTQDFQPNRIQAAKQVAYEFINSRPDDNIGLTLFGGDAFTQCPLTSDHAALLSMFKNVSCSLQQRDIISQGTAVGMGISSAVLNLQSSKAKSKIVILLTDGANNTGEISPSMAAEMAKKLGIRVYTISMGTNASAITENGDTLSAESDTESLKQIAQTTGGVCYHAQSKEMLRNIYKDIDKLEKTKLKVANYDKYYDAYQPFALALVLCLLLELLLRITWFRQMTQ